MVLFTCSLDAKVNGEFIQITPDTSIAYKGEMLLKNFLYKRGLQGRNFFPMKTTPRAKLTDFMNSAAAPFPSQLIVSKKLQGIFESFPGQSFEVGRVKVNHGSQQLDYSIIGRTERMKKSIIDFENSKIAKLNWREQKYEPLNCDSINEMQKIKDAVFVNVSFISEMITGLHHFVCPLTNKMFISNEMAQLMVDKKISGIELYEYNENSDITQNALRKLVRLL